MIRHSCYHGYSIYMFPNLKNTLLKNLEIVTEHVLSLNPSIFIFESVAVVIRQKYVNIVECTTNLLIFES